MGAIALVAAAGVFVALGMVYVIVAALVSAALRTVGAIMAGPVVVGRIAAAVVFAAELVAAVATVWTVMPELVVPQVVIVVADMAIAARERIVAVVVVRALGVASAVGLRVISWVPLGTLVRFDGLGRVRRQAPIGLLSSPHPGLPLLQGLPAAAWCPSEPMPFLRSPFRGTALLAEGGAGARRAESGGERHGADAPQLNGGGAIESRSVAVRPMLGDLAPW